VELTEVQFCFKFYSIKGSNQDLIQTYTLKLVGYSQVSWLTFTLILKMEISMFYLADKWQLLVASSQRPDDYCPFLANT